MGKIFKEVRGVFGYEMGFLVLKIKVFEDLGLSKLFVLRIIVCSLRIFVGDMNVEVGKVLEILKIIGIGVEWVNENLLEDEEEFYDWRFMYWVLSLFRGFFVNDSELCELVKKYLRFVFEDLGEWMLFLVGFLIKFGLFKSEFFLFFFKFLEIEVKKCVLNLRYCFLFLKKIKMECDEIGKIFCFYFFWFGVCFLKKFRILFDRLNVGIRWFC